MALFRAAALVVLLQFITAHAQAGLFGRHRAPGGQRASSIALRRRLHVNPLITEPGTVEMEWNGLFSIDGDYSLPLSLKFTPEGRHIYWGRTEFSANLDLLASTTPDGRRITHFSDRVTVAANSVVYDGEKLDIAIAPLATFFLRNETGARLGAVAIARYDFGQNSAGLTASWTGATHASASNPAGAFECGAGLGRRLAASGLRGRFTVYTNLVFDKSTGLNRQWSVFEGVECQLTERTAVDLSGQHVNLAGGIVDHAILLGVTMNLGRPGAWFRRGLRHGPAT